MLGGGVDAATVVAALGAGPPPPECRWSRRPHRGATACRLLERDDRGVDHSHVESIGWLDTGYPLGCSSVREARVNPGRKQLIGVNPN